MLEGISMLRYFLNSFWLVLICVARLLPTAQNFQLRELHISLGLVMSTLLTDNLGMLILFLVLDNEKVRLRLNHNCLMELHLVSKSSR